MLIEWVINDEPVAVGLGGPAFTRSRFSDDNFIDAIEKSAQFESRQILHDVDGDVHYSKGHAFIKI